MGVLRVFVVLGGGGGDVGGAGPGLSPCLGAAHSLAERGVFIYYLWRVELSQDMEGAGGQCWCWWDTEGATRVSPAHPGFACVPKGAGKAQLWQVAVGAGMGLVALGPRVCPLG